jgi:hypothetical protein
LPWRGRQYPGEFPTLGYVVVDWVEANLIVPDGPLAGEPFLLTPEQQRFLLFHYRLDPASGRFTYRGSQLCRSQKWGKDPLAAAMACAEALGPVLFDGWDASGEPVGKEWPSPWIQIAAVSEDQTANTFRPIYTMLADGPLSDTPGLDIGETRIVLPSGGRLEPATSNAKSRLGARLTFAVLGETHLWTQASGGHALAANMKRNLAGMNGRWAEITNAYDPSEDSVAQRTHRGGARDVYLDWRPAPDPTISLSNRGELKKALRHCYGDSSWVDLDRIIAEILDPSTSPADARRYFLTLVTVGDRDLVDPVAWDAAARQEEPLRPKEPITLGFDGSKTSDSTALVACRISDGRLFPLRVWERPLNAAGPWKVPAEEVDTAVEEAFAAYNVWFFFGDPYYWQDYLDKWAGRWPKKVVEYPTNNERRIDAAVNRFLTAMRAGQLTHDGSEVLTRAIRSTALAHGTRKASRDDDPDPAGQPEGPGLSAYYLRPVKKKRSVRIDATLAALLAYEARGRAIEEGALSARPTKPRLW